MEMAVWLVPKRVPEVKSIRGGSGRRELWILPHPPKCPRRPLELPLARPGGGGIIAPAAESPEC